MPKYFERIVLNEAQLPVFEICENNKLTKTLKPEDKGLFREKTFIMLFNRTALDPLRMVNVSATFAQKILFKIPNRDGYDYHYFYWEKGMSVHVKCIDPRLKRFCGYCSSVSVSDAMFVKKIGAPKRLTKEQVQKIVKEGMYEGIPYLGCFGELDGAEFVAPKSD